MATRLSLRLCMRAMSSKADILKAHDQFVHRHIGPTSERDISTMLKTCNLSSVDELIDKTIPGAIRYADPIDLPPPQGEEETLAQLKEMMGKNKVARSHIGMGYYDTHVPKVILRNLMENPGWYTPYTPYQPEIAQGRLEMLLNYQTMLIDLTGMPVANASLLDEGTAAAEALNMVRHAKKPVYLIADDVHPQTIDVIKTRAATIGVEVRVKALSSFDFSAKDVSGVLIQYPSTDGRIHDLKGLTEDAHAAGAKVVVASDLLALCNLTPPGEWGADVVVGTAQRFGVPLGYGGPHAAFFCTGEAYKRKMPGRIIGVSKDSRGKPALRMAMQTREQHIRRDKASSNICTAQALLANMSAAYAVYHGPQGLQRISDKVHAMAKLFAAGATDAGYTINSMDFFDTVRIDTPKAAAVVAAAEAKLINLRLLSEGSVCISFDETTTATHVNELVAIFAEVNGSSSTFNAVEAIETVDVSFPAHLKRSSEYLTHPIFHMNHCETDMMRYLMSLQKKDLGLDTGMIPLGSCTMKLNAAVEMIPVTWPEVNGIHPFAPKSQVEGYAEFLDDTIKMLSVVTGFHTVSLQPNSGAQGEYAGLLAIKAYHESRGDMDRNICIIPDSAHGTNPASAVMAAFKVVVVKCDKAGNMDMDDFNSKVQKHKSNLGAFMITYPSTHGVFEENIKEMCQIIHDNGGQVYMDGANMNAQVGLTSPGSIGADVCHLNLHKTFCIPHGGGGPGMGPIGVQAHLEPFLPNHSIVKMGGEKAVGPVCSAPWSSASILPITWMYIKMMGEAGLTQATKIAILNANYMATRLSKHYTILFTGKNGTCAHEFIIDLRDFKNTANIVEEDIAKRLQDYTFHSPTMSWPVGGTIMVEPTESEPLYEMDRFCDAMISIRAEIAEIEAGLVDKKDNLLKNAPHTQDMVISTEWTRPYSREKAAFPMPYLKQSKFWPTTGRLDNVFGDRNVICSCPPLSDYSDE